MKLYLVRHTRLSIDYGICYGQADVDVAPSFYDELRSIKAKLAEIEFDALYCSPLQRCLKLAEAIAPGRAIADDRLKELHFGDWELQRWDDIPRDLFDHWADDYASLSPPPMARHSLSCMRARGNLSMKSKPFMMAETFWRWRTAAGYTPCWRMFSICR